MTEDDSQSDSSSSNGGVMPSAVFDISRRGLNALAVSPDGTRLATAARDGVVRIHELTTGALLSGFRVRLPFPYHPSFSSLGPVGLLRSNRPIGPHQLAICSDGTRVYEYISKHSMLCAMVGLRLMSCEGPVQEGDALRGSAGLLWQPDMLCVEC